VTAVLRPKLRATAFRFVGGVAPTPTDWFVIGERFDEENPTDAAATIVHLRPGDTQVLATIGSGARQLQASRAGLCVLGADGGVRIKPRHAGPRTKAHREQALVSCGDCIEHIGGSLRRGFWLRRDAGALVVLDVSLDSLDAIAHSVEFMRIPAGPIGPCVSDDTGFAMSVGLDLHLGGSTMTSTTLAMTAPIRALTMVGADAKAVVIADDAGRIGLVPRDARKVADVQWLGQTDALGPIDCVGVVGQVIVLGSQHHGLFVWRDGQALPLRPSLRASHIASLPGGLLITSDLFVAHFDGVDFMARDLSSTIRAAESA
jgi:hypothetical protein